MGNFIKHIPCPQCGSKDNAAIYDDGGVYCYSCRKFIVDKTDGTFTSNNNKPSPEYVLPPLQSAPLENRNIHHTAVNKYRVGVDEYFTYVYFPYYLDGKCIGAKKRSIDRWESKEYSWIGDGRNIGLFGIQTASPKINKLLIVEGELDALAAYQIVGTDYNVVSIAHGADGAAKDLAKHMEFVNSHLFVYLCFDNDEAGQRATEACKELIMPGKTHLVVLPDGIKDANDMLKAKREREFRSAVNEAQRLLPKDYIVENGEIIKIVDKSIEQDKKGCQFPTQFPSLNRAIGGLNPGELITLAAGTGVGKTTLGLSLVLNAMKQGRKVFLITLETNPADVLRKLLEMHTGLPLYSNPGPITVERSQYIDALEWIADHVAVYTGMGSMSMEKLESLIQYGAMAGTHDTVFLDHITAATQTVNNNQVQVIDATMSMLNRLTSHYRLSTIVISHVSRTDNGKLTLDSLRNSSGIAQYSHAVIGLSRNIEEVNGLVEVRILKGHRRFGFAAPFNMKYNPLTYQYEEVNANGRPTQEAGNSSSASLSEKISEVREQKEEKRRREVQLQEPLRSTDSRTVSEPAVRTSEDIVHEDVHTGLPDYQPDWKEDTNRGEGIPKARRPFKTITGQEVEPIPTLETLVQLTQQRDNWFRQAGESPNICGMGRASRFHVGRGPGDTGDMVQ